MSHNDSSSGKLVLNTSLTEMMVSLILMTGLDVDVL